MWQFPIYVTTTFLCDYLPSKWLSMSMWLAHILWLAPCIWQPISTSSALLSMWLSYSFVLQTRLSLADDWAPTYRWISLLDDWAPTYRWISLLDDWAPTYRWISLLDDWTRTYRWISLLDDWAPGCWPLKLVIVPKQQEGHLTVQSTNNSFPSIASGDSNKSFLHP